MRARPSEQLVWCYVTAKDRRQALRLARAVVEERLAACANVLGGIDSVYWWDGRVQSGREVAVVMKTRRRLVKRLAARIAALHTYDCPCVVALPILDGHPPFLAWLAGETA